VLPVVGTAAVVINAAMITLIIWFHKNLGITHISTAFAYLGGTVLVGVLYYYTAQAIQKRRGVDVSLAFKAIPPE
jgi:hypothetical protein